MIRAIIFDCFGVLYRDASWNFYEREVKNYDALRPQLIDLNKQSDYGLISKKEWKSAIAEVTGLDEDFVATNVQGVHDRNEQLLEMVKSYRKKYKIGMLSNIGEGAMDEFFSPHERALLFDAVVLSSDVGTVKPNPEIFTIMADRLGVKPWECIMVDDIADNCHGAEYAGMSAVQFHTNDQVAHELTELLKKGDNA